MKEARKMTSKKKVITPEKHLLKPQKVTCEDCRFIREENTDGDESYICLAHARRSIDPREEKECQRFLENAVDQKKDFIEFKQTNKENIEVFDTKKLYDLMTGKEE